MTKIISSLYTMLGPRATPQYTADIIEAHAVNVFRVSIKLFLCPALSLTKRGTMCRRCFVVCELVQRPLACTVRVLYCAVVNLPCSSLRVCFCTPPARSADLGVLWFDDVFLFCLRTRSRTSSGSQDLRIWTLFSSKWPLGWGNDESERIFQKYWNC